MSGTAFRVVIPARYGSTRLPGKALIKVAGREMVLRVCDQAARSGASEVIVATDDQRIADVVAGAGYCAELTGNQHRSGSERIAELVARRRWSDDAVIVNVQGDEPLMPPDLIAAVARQLGENPVAAVATLATELSDRSDIFNPHCVKVVLDRRGFAMYFSRAPIPWHREVFAQDGFGPISNCYRHLGIYAYRAGFLTRYVAWEPAPLEDIECLEQLRILWHGESIAVAVVDALPEAGIDTEADLRRVEGFMVMAGMAVE